MFFWRKKVAFRPFGLGREIYYFKMMSSNLIMVFSPLFWK